MRTGIGLRATHYQAFLETLPNVGWIEVHSENYFGKGGKPFYYLEQICRSYPISFHGVGLSLGSTDPLNFQHLEKLKNLVTLFDPIFVSEHLSWSSVEGQFLNDLLPLPYTEETLNHMAERIKQVQDYLGRPILIENISSYIQFSSSNIPEQEFITALAEKTGCGILLDINNLYVNSKNHGWDAHAYLAGLSYVQEIHLAGFTENDFFLLDTHNQPVADAVWNLYKEAISHMGKKPTLIEWDTDLPPLETLILEAEKANAIT